MKKQTAFAKLKEREKKARQKIIVDAAERVFSTKPFNKVSMRDIAGESGISLSSIYRYFPDQQSLFIEALSRGTKKMQARLHRIITGNDHLLIEHVTDAFIDFLIDNDAYFRMMTHFMIDGELGADSIKKLNAMERKLLDEFDLLFQQLNISDDIRLHSHSFFAALNGILITFRQYPGRDHKEVRQHMKRVGEKIALMFSKPTD